MAHLKGEMAASSMMTPTQRWTALCLLWLPACAAHAALVLARPRPLAHCCAAATRGVASSVMVQSGGDYQVSSGMWPVEPKPERKATPRRGSGHEGRARNRGAAGAKSGRGGAGLHKRSGSRAQAVGRTRKVDGSPVLGRVLQRVAKLSPTASLDEIDELLRGKKLTSRDYGTVLRELRLGRKWGVALRVGEWLHSEPGPLPNAMHYMAMLHACAASDQPEPALGLLDEMAQRAVTLEPKLRAQALSHAISAHKRADALEPLLPLLDQLDELLEGGAEPSSLTFGYSAAIRAFDLRGKWSVSLQLYERALEVGVPLDAPMYGAVLGACRSGKQVQPALDVIERLRADGAVAPNSVLYNLAMGACVRGGEWEAALRLFDERRGGAKGTGGRGGEGERGKDGGKVVGREREGERGVGREAGRVREREGGREGERQREGERGRPHRPRGRAARG